MRLLAVVHSEAGQALNCCTPYKKGAIAGTAISIRVQTRASRKGLQSIEEESAQLKWGVSAAPVEGKANEELCRAIADSFGIAKGRVSVVSGVTSRNKVIVVESMSVEAVEELLRKVKV